MMAYQEMPCINVRACRCARNGLCRFQIKSQWSANPSSVVVTHRVRFARAGNETVSYRCVGHK
jgi:hypothetical protein